MSAIEKLFPTSPQERSFQMKARRDAGTAAPDRVPPQFVECKKCGRRATRQVWVKSQYVCPNCGVHLAIGAYYRLSTVLDHGTFKELNPDIAPNDVLQFPDYQEKLAAASVKTGLKEAAVTAIGRIGGVQAVVAVLDSRFFMGSMSTAVGEKITRAIEYAADKHLPLIIFSASGGARMQEGIFSLMQMAKTSAALERFNRSGGLYISVLTHPTTGGVTASFASLGDITLAEPGALIGFAGPRVIEQTIGEKLPDGFQRSEFQLEHGFVDQVVPRTELKEVLTRILQLHTQGRKRR
ncbi:acetyl-CoA carboxylase, carboxyltransferase subunit beta [Gemmiger formicilis]|uniref:acetyl-CoA carboxylase, carboxyltransferase subunit beta n=1 Tax=Gemmiger formicilis TaxID=745368 RepID=UPI00351FB422